MANLLINFCLKPNFLLQDSELVFFQECFVMVPIWVSHLAKAQSTMKSLTTLVFYYGTSVGANWPNTRQDGQKVLKKWSMKNRWQRWKSYFSGQDLTKFGKKIIYLFYFSTHWFPCTSVQYAKHVPICKAEEMMRPANYAKLVSEFLLIIRGCPTGDVKT
jgi:hypothetical protein